ncbi:hypothetical protein EVAR_43515_1 [Eumeta japonica]|uniref:Uncharacterized protein n=1 Tax=Eumeta variegata TaxID=151549 RepID=A0A4C1YLU3_EUMVA|nr:hypothetical protein EVAR_43515_1 [Eumeta japonica]
MAFYVTRAAGFATSCIFIKTTAPIEGLYIPTCNEAGREREPYCKILSTVTWYGAHLHEAAMHSRLQRPLSGARRPPRVTEGWRRAIPRNAR